MKDGKNITDEMAAWRNSKENKSSLVQCITELIRVGPYESLLKNCNQPIKVIAIVGRQSGGIFKHIFLKIILTICLFLFR